MGSYRHEGRKQNAAINWFNYESSFILNESNLKHECQREDAL